MKPVGLKNNLNTCLISTLAFYEEYFFRSGFTALPKVLLKFIHRRRFKRGGDWGKMGVFPNYQKRQSWRSNATSVIFTQRVGLVVGDFFLLQKGFFMSPFCFQKVLYSLSLSPLPPLPLPLPPIHFT